MCTLYHKQMIQRVVCISTHFTTNSVRARRQTTSHFHVHVCYERRRLSCENGVRFPVTGGNFIHTCRHVHIVFAGACLCAGTCGQASVCVWPADAHLQQQSICRRRSWCRQSSLRYMYTRYHTQQRAELDRVPFYFMNFSPTVTSNMCRGT